MLFKKDNKIAFVLPPKTGSMSLKHLLLSLNFKQLSHSRLPVHHHIKYVDAVSHYPTLAEYKLFGVFRNPLDRFLSVLRYIRGENLSYSYEYFVDSFEKTRKTRFMFFTPQVEWLNVPNMNVIMFDNLVEGVMDAVKDIEGEKHFPHLHKSIGVGEPVTDKVRNFVRDYYAVDYEFAKNVLGKEY